MASYRADLAKAMRERAAQVTADHENDASTERNRKHKTTMLFISEEVRAEIYAEERGEKIASEMIAKKIRALPIEGETS